MVRPNFSRLQHINFELKGSGLNLDGGKVQEIKIPDNEASQESKTPKAPKVTTPVLNDDSVWPAEVSFRKNWSTMSASEVSLEDSRVIEDLIILNADPEYQGLTGLDTKLIREDHYLPPGFETDFSLATAGHARTRNVTSAPNAPAIEKTFDFAG